jgi:dihydrodipicolinate synthase/N-acetylneuraminate lyase
VRSVEEARPCPGLSVPVVTALDGEGDLVDADQRAVVRHVLQDGYGANVVFAAGTTGEWDKVDNDVRQRVVQVSVEEVTKANARRGPGSGGRAVEAWAGVTAPSRRETLDNLDFAISCGADAAVIAPLSIENVDDPVRFVARDVSDLLDARDRRIPVYLYDNADIAIDPKVPHIRTRQVKAMSRLDFVRGIKVSASRRVLGNYTQAAAGFKERGEFGIYVGNALLIFDLFRPRRGWLGTIYEHWQRWRMRGGVPIGVVAGPANPMPREWARAWQVCRAGDVERMDDALSVLEAFREASRAAGSKKSIACLKRALWKQGVIQSAAVAPGTSPLSPEEALRFDAAFERVQALAREKIGAPWVSQSEASA